MHYNTLSKRNIFYIYSKKKKIRKKIKKEFTLSIEEKEEINFLKDCPIKEILERIKKSKILKGNLRKKGIEDTKKSKKNIPKEILYENKRFINNNIINTKVNKGKNFSKDI